MEQLQEKLGSLETGIQKERDKVTPAGPSPFRLSCSWVIPALWTVPAWRILSRLEPGAGRCCLWVPGILPLGFCGPGGSTPRGEHSSWGWGVQGCGGPSCGRTLLPSVLLGLRTGPGSRLSDLRLPAASGPAASVSQWSQLLPLPLSDIVPACRGRASHAQDAQHRTKRSDVEGPSLSLHFDSIFPAIRSLDFFLF